LTDRKAVLEAKEIREKFLHFLFSDHNDLLLQSEPHLLYLKDQKSEEEVAWVADLTDKDP
jgi:hypothetical protein